MPACLGHGTLPKPQRGRQEKKEEAKIRDCERELFLSRTHHISEVASLYLSFLMSMETRQLAVRIVRGGHLGCFSIVRRTICGTHMRFLI